MERLKAGSAIPAYRIDGQGRPLVLIMGVGGTKEAWALQTRAFRPYFRVITFDNRGVGRFEGPRQPFTIEVMVRDTITLLDHLGIDQAHILGYSLGGIVAQEIAIGHPGRVMKLILASTLARGGATEDVTIDARRALGPEPSDGDRRRDAMPTLIELSFNRWAYRLALGLVARVYARRIRPEGLADQMRVATSANTLGRLGSIEAKTLVLTGTGDRLIDPSASRLLASRIPHAKLVMIEGGSHAMAIEMRGEFNAAVLHFLRED